VSFIDVGQGDATLVQAGGESYLVDGGPPEAGPEVVDFLRSRGVEELDGLVASHPDADHIGGLPDVLDALPVSTVYVSGDASKATTTFNTFLRAVEREGARVLETRAGTRMEWGGAEVMALSPPPEAEGGLFGDSNEDSVALLLTFGAARVLLPGDAEHRAEEYMSTGRFTGPLTVLKVAHHGSSSSTTPLFLNRFRPEVAVISAGEENSYGHPTPQTLRRLKTVGAEVFRTDEDGDVIVTIEDGQVEVAITGY
jgi:beta-lactamase superfamily II metal-dependent hydrolase